MAKNQQKVKLMFNNLFNEDVITVHPDLNKGYLYMEKICQEYNLAVKPKEFVHFGAYVFSLLPQKDWFVALNMLIITWEVDDILDIPQIDLTEKYKILDSVQNLLAAGKLEPYTGGAHLLRDTLSQIKCEHLRKYFADRYAEYIDGIRKHLEEYGSLLVTNEILKDTERYFQFRKLESGCDFTWCLLFLDRDCFGEIENFISRGTGEKAWLVAVKHVCIINDVLSLEKDKGMGIIGNFVISWMKQYNVTEEEAIDELLREGKTLLDKLESMGQSGEHSDAVRKLILWCKGHIIWGSTTPRYS